VQRTLANPILVMNDIVGLKNIMSLSKNTGVKRVFYSSSSEVYGEPVELPQNELTTPLNSRLPYAIVKNVGEAYLKAYKKEFDMDYTIFRFFNTFGPAQSREFVISKFIAKALRNDDITIYGDGSQTRTFCYIDDNVDACLSAFYNDMYINDVVNIGSDEEITILDLAKKVIEITGSKSQLMFLPPLDEGDMSRRHPDNAKMKKLMDRDLLDLESGIRKVLEKSFYLLSER
ncbi:MAG TPA: epimerase, partial [Flavobacteriales bacterium]|nr:epimerase [Flavobacteriales bacterium]